MEASSSGLETAISAAADGTVVAAGGADAHEGRAGAAHDRLHVGEVQVDQARGRDQVGDALDAGEQDLVGRAERVERAHVAVADREQPVVRDDDEGVDLGAQLVDAGLGLGLPRRLPSKANGRVTTPTVSAPSWRAMRATTGAPPVPVPPPSPAVTKTMSAPLRTSSISSAWSSAACRPTSGSAPGAEPAGELAADVELHVGVAHEQRLRVGVDGDELDALEPDLDHPVDGVDAAAADADDLDDRDVVLRCRHGIRPS